MKRRNFIKGMAAFGALLYTGLLNYNVENIPEPELYPAPGTISYSEAIKKGIFTQKINIEYSDKIYYDRNMQTPAVVFAFNP